jgi:protease secretion system membrane fusion protein
MADIAILRRKPASTDVVPREEPDLLDDGAYATDTGRAGRVGLWALAIGFGGFLLWAAVAPLDEGVPAPGLVSIDTKRKTVQHLTGGIVREVLVKEGDPVKEGQVLVRLDGATAKANYESSHQRYLGLRVVESRLLAERSGSAKITFHPDLVAESKDPTLAAQMATQEQLMATRRTQLTADLQSLNEQIRGQQESVKAYQEILASRRQQLAILAEQLRNLRPLVQEGYATRNQQSDLERLVADVNSAIADALGNMMRARSAIADLNQRITSRQQDFRKEVGGNLADVSRELVSEGDKMRALKADLDRIEIRSPATGQVVSLAVQTAGGVITPGQKIMDVVPADEPLLLEAHVAPNYIDRVRPGLAVDVRFSAFAHTPTLVVDGKVISVSKDAISDPGANQPPYYLARVAVTPEGYRKLGNRQLQPGMATEIVIRTGERSLLTYLMAPVTKRVAGSMKEE